MLHRILTCVLAVCTSALAQSPIVQNAKTDPAIARAFDVLPKYAGKTGQRMTTMTGHVFAGYQGWFNTPSDGANLGWRHWGKGKFEPGTANVDLWPDTSELDPDERVPTPFRKADGSVAYVYNAANAKTIARHFRWMRDYGLDGVFVQRFATETLVPVVVKHQNTVLNAVRKAANDTDRAYSIMYDLSGLGEGDTQAVIDDWKRLVDRGGISRSKQDGAYLQHNQKPVVAVWGIGFDDGRKYTLDECGALIDFLKNDPTYGGNTVMIGVPTYWRTAGHDTVKDPKLLDVIAKADVVSPWTVGRYSTPEYAGKYAREVVEGDIAWCKERHIEFMPVMFAGFSWHNMKPESKSDDIPRRGGAFLWAQAVANTKAGATMGYLAMFDEVDEGTALYKLDPNPPVGPSIFVNEKALPADHYLRLSGQITKLFGGKIDATDELPKRRADVKTSP